MSHGDRETVHEGGCQCGAIRYALFTAPKEVSACHCRMCQKAVGQPFAVYATVAVEEFAWTRGEPATFQSSSIAARDFCPRCGTPLSFRYFNSGEIELSVGSFDRPAAIVPDRHYGIESRLPWLDHFAEWPATTTEASTSAVRRAGMVSHQHPDRDPTGAGEPA